MQRYLHHRMISLDQYDKAYHRAASNSAGYGLASLGYKLSQTKNMAVTRGRKQHRSTSVSSKHGSRSRSYHTNRSVSAAGKVFSKSRSHSRHSRSHRGSIASSHDDSREEPVGAFKPSVKKGKKRVKQKTTKEAKVHPSSNFRALVKKTLDAQDIHGTYTSLHVGMEIPEVNIPYDKQYYCHGFDARIASVTAATTATNATPWSFTTDQFLQAAAVIFNRQTPTNTAAALANQLVAGNFDYGQLKLHVKNSYTRYLMKNNNKRVQIMRIYLCAPKQAMPYDPRDLGSRIAMPQYTGAGAGISHESPLSPMQCFEVAGGTDVAEDRVLMFPNNAFPDTISPSFSVCGIHVTPVDYPTFRKSYATEYTEVTLEPGQSFTYHVQGPKWFTLDYSKITKGLLTMNVQKYSRCPLVFVRNDLCGETAAANALLFGGRANAAAAENILTGIVVERTDHYSLDMPQETGGQTSLSTGVLGNTLRNRRPYHVKAQFAFGTAPTANTADIMPQATNAVIP